MPKSWSQNSSCHGVQQQPDESLQVTFDTLPTFATARAGSVSNELELRHSVSIFEVNL